MGLGIAPIPFLIIETMVEIKTFKFGPTYENIVIDVQLPSYESASTAYIKQVIVGTLNAYDVEEGKFNFEDEVTAESYNTYYNVEYHNYGWVFTAKDTTPSTKKQFTANDLNIITNNLSINDLYFIQVITDGTFSENTLCSNTGDTWGSLYDSFSIDAKGMQYMKELADDCSTPTGMIDYILNKNAIDVAAGCGDYATMISRYNELMGYSNVTTIGSVGNNYKKCGCNGY